MSKTEKDVDIVAEYYESLKDDFNRIFQTVRSYGWIPLSMICAAYVSIPLKLNPSGDALLLHIPIVVFHSNTSLWTVFIDRVVTCLSLVFVYFSLLAASIQYEKTAVFQRYQIILTRINTNWALYQTALNLARTARNDSEIKPVNYGVAGVLSYFALQVGKLSAQETSGMALYCQMLRNRDYSGLDLSDADLSNSDLRRAILIDTNFAAASCINTRFDEAVLFDADFTNADLNNCSFNGAKLHGAKFSIGTDFAIFEKADFSTTRKLWEINRSS